MAFAALAIIASAVVKLIGASSVPELDPGAPQWLVDAGYMRTLVQMQQVSLLPTYSPATTQFADSGQLALIGYRTVLLNPQCQRLSAAVEVEALTGTSCTFDASLLKRLVGCTVFWRSDNAALLPTFVSAVADELLQTKGTSRSLIATGALVAALSSNEAYVDPSLRSSTKQTFCIRYPS